MIWKPLAKLYPRAPGVRTPVGTRLAEIEIPERVPAILALGVLVFFVAPFLASALLRIPVAPWSELSRASLMSALRHSQP